MCDAAWWPLLGRGVVARVSALERCVQGKTTPSIAQGWALCWTKTETQSILVCRTAHFAGPDNTYAPTLSLLHLHHTCDDAIIHETSVSFAPPHKSVFHRTCAWPT